MNKVVHFLLTLLIMFVASIAPAQALLKGGTWQELNSATAAVNGTVPRADGAIIPVYQGSMLLDPTKTYDVAFTAMPRDFSADATSTSMRAVNSTDTEGDLFSDPPTIAWENQQPPSVGLLWADAATPDTPLSPQPMPNQTFAPRTWPDGNWLSGRSQTMKRPSPRCGSIPTPACRIMRPSRCSARK